jgi:hypothetical protein
MSELSLTVFLTEEIQYLTESEASEMAHKLGLQYKGHGYWMDDSGLTVAQTVKGKLVKLNGAEYDPDNVHKSKKASAKANVDLARLALKKTMDHALDFVGIDADKGDPQYKALEKILIKTIENDGRPTHAMDYQDFSPAEQKMVSKYLDFVEGNPDALFYKAIKDYTDQKKQSAELPDDEEAPFNKPKVDKKKAAKGLIHKLDKGGSSAHGLDKTIEILTGFLATPTPEEFQSSVNALAALKEAGYIKSSLFRNVSNLMNKILSATSQGEVDALVAPEATGGYNAKTMEMFNAAFPADQPMDAFATPEAQTQIQASLDALVSDPTGETLAAVLSDFDQLNLSNQITPDVHYNLTNSVKEFVGSTAQNSLGFKPEPTQPEEEPAVDPAVQATKDFLTQALGGEQPSPHIVDDLLNILSPLFQHGGMTPETVNDVNKYLDYKADNGQISYNLVNNIKGSLNAQVAQPEEPAQPEQPEPPQQDAGPNFDVAKAMQLMGIDENDPNYAIILKYVTKAADATLNYGIYNVGQALKKKQYITPKQWKTLLKYTQNAKGGLKNTYYTYKHGPYYGKKQADQGISFDQPAPTPKKIQSLNAGLITPGEVVQNFIDCGFSDPSPLMALSNDLLGGQSHDFDELATKVQSTEAGNPEKAKEYLNTIFNFVQQKNLGELKPLADATLKMITTHQPYFDQATYNVLDGVYAYMGKMFADPQADSQKLMADYNLGEFLSNDELADMESTVKSVAEKTKKKTIPTQTSPEGKAAANLLSNALEFGGLGLTDEETDYLFKGLQQAIGKASFAEAEDQLSDLVSELEVPSSVYDQLLQGMKNIFKTKNAQQSATDIAAKNVLKSIYGDDLSNVDVNTLDVVKGFITDAINAVDSKDAYAQIVKLQDAMQLTDAEAYNLFDYVNQEREKLAGSKPELDTPLTGEKHDKAISNIDQMVQNLTGDSTLDHTLVPAKIMKTLMKAMVADNHIDFLKTMYAIKGDMKDPDKWAKWMKAALQARPDMAEQLANVKAGLGVQPSAEVPSEPTPLEQPNAPKDKPSTPHDFLDADDDEAEDVFGALEAAKKATGMSIKNMPVDVQAQIAHAIHNAIDTGNAEGVQKELHKVVQLGMPSEYAEALKAHILDTWGWNAPTDADAIAMAQLPPSILQSADKTMKQFIYNFGKGENSPPIAYQKAMSWLNKKFGEADTPAKKKYYEQFMQAMHLKYGKKLNPQLTPAATPPAPVKPTTPTASPTPTVAPTAPAAPSYVKQVADALTDFDAVRKTVVKNTYDEFMKDLPQFQKLTDPQKQQLMQAITGGLGELSYNDMKYNHVKPLMQSIPGFDQAAYEKLKYILKPIMQQPSSPYMVAKTKVAQQIQLKNDAEKAAKEKEYYDLLYGKGASDFKFTPYNEPIVGGPKGARVRHVMQNVIDDIGFGPGALPGKERHAYLTTITNALTVPQNQVNQTVDDLFNTTSLNADQIKAIKKAVHTERHKPKDLQPDTPKADKPTAKAKDMFTPKFTLANLPPEKHAQATTILGKVVNTEGPAKVKIMMIDAENALKKLGVPSDVAKRWTKWAAKLQSSGATVDDKGKVSLPTGSSTATSNVGTNIDVVPIHEDPYNIINKVWASGETVKKHPAYTSAEGIWETPYAHDNFSHTAALASKQAADIAKHHSPKLVQEMQAAVHKWQGSGQWGHSLETRKKYNAVFTKILEGPPKQMIEPTHGFIERGLSLDPNEFTNFIKAFRVGEPVYLGPSGFTENRTLAKGIASHCSGGHVGVLLRITGNSKGKLKGMRIQNYGCGGEHEIITGTAPTLRVKKVIKHVLPAKHGGNASVRYEIVMQEEDSMNESITGTQASYWKGLDRETIKVLIKKLNSSVHTR